MTRTFLISIAALSLVTAACGDEGGDTADPTDATQTTITETTDATQTTDTTVIGRGDLEALADQAAEFGDRLEENPLADEAGLTQLWSRVETSFETAIASLSEDQAEVDVGAEVFSDLMADLEEFQRAIDSQSANLDEELVAAWDRFMTDVETTVAR